LANFSVVRQTLWLPTEIRQKKIGPRVPPFKVT